MGIGKKIMKILGINTEKRKIGDKGEDIAAKFLRKSGYKILERNYVALGYEIDIIASKDDVTAFVEVKTRTVKDGKQLEYRPAAAVTKDKQRKILRAAACYKGYSGDARKMRFDIIEVYIKKDEDGKESIEPKHLIGTFDKDTAYSARIGEYK